MNSRETHDKTDNLCTKLTFVSLDFSPGVCLFSCVHILPSLSLGVVDFFVFYPFPKKEFFAYTVIKTNAYKQYDYLLYKANLCFFPCFSSMSHELLPWGKPIFLYRHSGWDLKGGSGGIVVNILWSAHHCIDIRFCFLCSSTLFRCHFYPWPPSILYAFWPPVKHQDHCYERQLRSIVRVNVYSRDKWLDSRSYTYTPLSPSSKHVTELMIC